MKENNEPQFIDTCILLYAYDNSESEKHQQAVTLVSDLWKSGRGALSIQVLQEFYVNITQKVANPLTARDASQIVFDLGQWKLHRPGLDSILKAIEIQQRYKISFWDSLIICSSQNLGCKIIWTEDLNNKQYYGETQALNPFSYQDFKS